MQSFFKPFDKYYIGIQTKDGRKHCIRGWYLDKRFAHSECPKGYHMDSSPIKLDLNRPKQTLN